MVTANFGASRANLTGSGGVGYTVFDITGSVTTARTTTGVYQITSGSGMYAAFASFPDSFNGSILWDTGGSSPLYAVEQFNYEANNPNVDVNNTLLNQLTGSMAVSNAMLQFLYDMEGGRWKIDAATNQM